jgi:hypothetical protein
MEDTLKIKGTYHLKIVRADGSVKDAWSVNNIVTNAGKAQLALLAGDSTADPFTYIAVGTSSTAVSAAQTALQAETTTSGLSRAAGTVSRTTTTVSNDTFQVTKTFTASGTVAVEEVGIFNASSSGTMLSRALTGTKTIVSTEQLVVTYTLAFA